MAFERREGCRFLVFVEVGGRGDQHAPTGRQAMGYEAAVADRTVADHCVVPSRCDIDETVIEIERQGDVRMLLEERDQRRREVQAAEADRRGQAQRPG